MTPAQINGNRSIAEYMGWSEEKAAAATKEVEKRLDNQEMIEYVNYYLKEENFSYHCSWDSLIPVIGKIRGECEEPEGLGELRNAVLTNNIDEAFNIVVSYVNGDAEKAETITMEWSSEDVLLNLLKDMVEEFNQGYLTQYEENLILAANSAIRLFTKPSAE